MRLSVIALSMYLIGAISVSSYPIGGSESESESCRSKLGRWVDGLCDLSSGKAKVPKGDSSKPTETIQGTSKSSAIKGRVEVPTEDSYKPKGTTKGLFQWFKSKGKDGSSKEDPSKPTKTTKSSSKLTSVSDDDGPKPLEAPPIQKQNNGNIKTPKKGPNRGSSGPAGLDMNISTGSHQTKESKGSALGQTKGGSLKPKESAQDPSAQYMDSDDDRPKPLQDFRTQEQNNGVITTPKKGPNRGSSGPAGLDMNISTGSHQTKESKGSALDRNHYKTFEPKNRIMGVITTSKKGPNRGSSSSIDEIETSDLAKQSDRYWKQRNERFRLGKTESGGPKREVKLLKVSDNEGPKPLQVPQPQEQNDEDITTPKKGPSRGSSGPAGLDMNISIESHQTKESKGSALDQTKGAAPKGGLLKPTETTKSSSTWYVDSDNDKPKPPQSPPTQKQSNGVINTPKKESNSGSSSSTGPTSLDMNIDTDGHQTKESKGSTLGQTKGAAPKEDTLKPTKTTKGSSKLTKVSDDDGPKPLQDPPTQKQNNGVINTPKVGSKHGSSGPTGAAVGPNGAIDTDTHQAKESNDSTLGQAKGADSSIPNSSALESTNPDLSDQLIDPQEKRRPIPNPTPSKPTPEVTSVHEFFSFG
ncbi:hypothetical protein BASA62_004082 [Batrachochytrium salamandrivorans]|nr:hypothetical protein BASA62_004082 [Batrachochytrium salamandrivorans]